MLGGFHASIKNRLLHFWGLRLEYRLTDDQGFEREQITDIGNVFLYLIKLHRRYGAVGVVLTINHLLLQCCKGFSPCQWCGVQAPCVIGGNHDLVTWYANH